jgi:succinate-semialdehyde dehydrogenase
LCSFLTSLFHFSCQLILYFQVNTIVLDAIKKGARVHLGGRPASSLGERFYEPTLLTNINESMMCYNEEIFGPVAVCIRQVSAVM